jgi:hypothetical protein
LQTISDGPAFTMGTAGARAAVGSNIPYPGPGDYHMDNNLSGKGPAFTIGYRSAPVSCTPEAPGPGEYHAAPKPQGPAYTISSKILRDDQAGSYPEVGPASYSLPVLIPSGPAFSVAARHPTKERLPAESTPGAGELHALLLL